MPFLHKKKQSCILYISLYVLKQAWVFHLTSSITPDGIRFYIMWQKFCVICSDLFVSAASALKTCKIFESLNWKYWYQFNVDSFIPFQEFCLQRCTVSILPTAKLWVTCRKASRKYIWKRTLQIIEFGRDAKCFGAQMWREEWFYCSTLQIFLQKSTFSFTFQSKA